MSNKTVEIINENGRMVLTQEAKFECTPQLEAILSLAKQWEISVVLKEPIFSGGIEQIECLFHPAGYEAVLNHDPGVIKIYEMNKFRDAAALDFERLVLTMMDIWKNTRRQEPQNPPAAANTPKNDCAICATFFGEGEDVWDEVLAADEGQEKGGVQ